MMKRKKHPQETITALVEILCPYVQSNLQKDFRPRTEDCEKAVMLMQASENTIKSASINTVRWYFCKRQIIGRNVRPTLTKEEIDSYLLIKEKPQWTYYDLL